MIYSMTGYATTDLQLPSTSIHIELKSVNHRFFDLSFRIPDEFKPLEPFIREIIINKIPRGKIDLRINLKDNQVSEMDINLNVNKLNNYIAIYKQIKDTLPELMHSSVTDILKLSGILCSETLELEQIKNIILDTINKLTDDLQITQETEGGKLAEIIVDKLNKIDSIVADALKALPEITQNHKNKLKQKLMEVFDDTTLNEQRFQQEFAYFCQRIDVDEELSRLSIHTKRFRSIVSQGGAIGKKIDFLTQEMLREANTFGSKSAGITTTEYAVELKVLIEQIKEQLQNIA